MVINLQGLVGFIKGMIGIVPKTWSAYKSKIYSRELFLGTYIIVILNIFTMFVGTEKYTVTFVIWALFVIATIGGGMAFLNRKRKPARYKLNIPMKFVKKMWLSVFALSTLMNITFFWLESHTHPDIYKVILLLLLMCLALYGFFMGMTYILILHKQKKLGY
jgi:archaellum biogenesis protein FlaJ (TadC family)